MLIVNPNFTTDRTIPLAVLEPGHVTRTETAAVTLGGKGVNVARVARAFGHQAPVVGFVPVRSAGLLTELAADEGADLRAVPVPGVARAASVLVERSGRVTVLNEPGPPSDAAQWEDLIAAVERAVPGHRHIACSGSVPPGSPPDAYALVVAAGRRAGVSVLVDTSGPALAGAIEAAPDVVSPNLSEAEALLYGTVAEEVEPSGAEVIPRAGRAVTDLLRRGPRHAIVSAGSHGAVFDDGAGQLLWCAAPEVKVVNPIGAGDSLVGGLVHALEAGQPWDEAVRTAIVVAAASCEQELAGGIDPLRVADLLRTAPHPVGVTAGAQPRPAPVVP
jgi:1-phosphofructokinase family hexose kinase